MDHSITLDMASLAVARIVAILTLAIGVTVMTLRVKRLETVLFCASLFMAICTWVALIAAVSIENNLVTAIYAFCISTTVSLQWAAMVVLSERKLALSWFTVPPAAAFFGAVLLNLSDDAVATWSSAILCLQLAVAAVTIVHFGSSVVRARTAILMASGYAISFGSAAARLVGEFFFTSSLPHDPMSPDVTNTLPFIASFVGTILITLSWVAALKDRAEAALADLAYQDELTGLANRRRLREGGRRFWERCRRDGSTFTLMTLDVDHFKQVNDRFGHDEGDRVLEAIGSIFRDFTPKPDIAARLGGEEFCLIFIGVDARTAHGFAEQLRWNFAEHLQLPDGSPVRFSAGIAQSMPTDPSVDAVYSRADSALYEAKASGRDCTVIHQGRQRLVA